MWSFLLHLGSPPYPGSHLHLAVTSAEAVCASELKQWIMMGHICILRLNDLCGFAWMKMCVLSKRKCALKDSHYARPSVITISLKQNLLFLIVSHCYFIYVLFVWMLWHVNYYFYRDIENTRNLFWRSDFRRCFSKIVLLSSSSPHFPPLHCLPQRAPLHMLAKCVSWLGHNDSCVCHEQLIFNRVDLKG